MIAEELREVYKAQPFRPFTLELVDGQKVDVPRPEFLSYSRTRRAVAVAGKTGGFKIIDVFLIQSIDIANGKATGRSRRSP